MPLPILQLNSNTFVIEIDHFRTELRAISLISSANAVKYTWSSSRIAKSFRYRINFGGSKSIGKKSVFYFRRIFTRL